MEMIQTIRPVVNKKSSRLPRPTFPLQVRVQDEGAEEKGKETHCHSEKAEEVQPALDAAHCQRAANDANGNDRARLQRSPAQPHEQRGGYAEGRAEVRHGLVPLAQARRKPTHDRGEKPICAGDARDPDHENGKGEHHERDEDPIPLGHAHRGRCQKGAGTPLPPIRKETVRATGSTEKYVTIRNGNSA
jgi:hypothetical protein